MKPAQFVGWFIVMVLIVTAEAAALASIQFAHDRALAEAYAPR
jgi:hypothetical protein